MTVGAVIALVAVVFFILGMIAGILVERHTDGL